MKTAFSLFSDLVTALEAIYEKQEGDFVEGEPVAEPPAEPAEDAAAGRRGG